LIGEGRPRYEAVLRAVLDEERLAEIPVAMASEETSRPNWSNGIFPALDSAALYVLIGLIRPNLIVEIGSGNSTRFSRKAITDGHLETRIISVDPFPRVEVDALCDETLRLPLESLDPAFVDQLGPGDILFFDGSHRTLMNSDVTSLWLDILPRLRQGVVVHVHDIFLPFDYPPEWASRFYSEQYMLAASLLAGADVGMVFASQYVQRSPELFAEVRERFASWGINDEDAGGASFWFVVGADVDPFQRV